MPPHLSDKVTGGFLLSFSVVLLRGSVESYGSCEEKDVMGRHVQAVRPLCWFYHSAPESLLLIQREQKAGEVSPFMSPGSSDLRRLLTVLLSRCICLSWSICGQRTETHFQKSNTTWISVLWLSNVLDQLVFSILMGQNKSGAVWLWGEGVKMCVFKLKLGLILECCRVIISLFMKSFSLFSQHTVCVCVFLHTVNCGKEVELQIVFIIFLIYCLSVNIEQ